MRAGGQIIGPGAGGQVNLMVAKYMKQNEEN